MSIVATVFPGFKLTSPDLSLREGSEYKSLAKVEPDLWEVKRAYDRGYERVAIFHRGELFHHQWNFEQTGVKTMPLSAIQLAQAYVVARGGDTQTIRNDLEGLNVLARKVIATIDLQDQGRAQSWAEKTFEDPLEGADELYHTCMGWAGDNLHTWRSEAGIKITQRLLWGIQKIAFTFEMKQDDNTLIVNKKFDLLTDIFAQANDALDNFHTNLEMLGWVKGKDVTLQPIDIERLRKERIRRNFSHNHQHNVEQSLKHSTLTSDCRTAESFANDLPPAMREEMMEAARNVNVEDAYPKMGGEELFQTRRDILGRLGELEAMPEGTVDEMILRHEEVSQLKGALSRL